MKKIIYSIVLCCVSFSCFSNEIKFCKKHTQLKVSDVKFYDFKRVSSCFEFGTGVEKNTGLAAYYNMIWTEEYEIPNSERYDGGVYYTEKINIEGSSNLYVLRNARNKLVELSERYAENTSFLNLLEFYIAVSFLREGFYSGTDYAEKIDYYLNRTLEREYFASYYLKALLLNEQGAGQSEIVKTYKKGELIQFNDTGEIIKSFELWVDENEVEKRYGLKKYSPTTSPKI
ncbi:MAG: hypothetical protein HRU38_17305 [Saccharospirillaceae bacterium]|nr:hypothetical protein [Pseudomonadales bacterium]NRB80396.1 hypothetical protein [Saccharospirillaceae bacterium]